jgi:predicted lipoprotein
LSITLAVSCVVVKHGEETKGGAGEGLEIYFANGNFDAKAYVAGMWDTKLLPYSHEKAVDLAVLLAQLAADEAGTSKAYGWRQVAEGAPFNFAVKGEAVVREVHTESRVGTAELDLAGDGGAVDGKTDVILQIGPVFKGTSIRDALPFVAFDDFVNQLDYAALSNELNTVVRERVIPKIDIQSLSGKRLSFYGFITFERGLPVVVTAVELEVK